MSTDDGNTELSGRGGDWDQFEANERMFGVKNTFDENLYHEARQDEGIPAAADGGGAPREEIEEQEQLEPAHEGGEEPANHR